IRDRNVTGVQTCALPISNIAETKLGQELIDLPVALGSRASGSTSAFSTLSTQPGVEIDNSGQISVAGTNVDMVSLSIDGISTTRSEERRVGKEGRSGGWT